MKKILIALMAGCFLAGACGLASAEDLIGSKNSDKYHLATCATAQKITADNKVTFKDAEAALKAGYAPCQKCKPPVVFVASKNSTVYHLPSCKMADKIVADNKVKFDTEADAQKAGYKPCQICFPKK
ncbi:MAG: hypothetical protein HQL18_02230 [Candidatus Omnitrophica bacterium]|nr:hypothetical protein [Candidatus Omnitrophota bacterium]